MSTFNERTALIADGTSIFYTDSGPPPRIDIYTTLVVIHGTGFNGHGFEALHGLVQQEGLRLVLINRRQYPGSTPYTEEEIQKMLDSGAAYFGSLARCLALFLVAFLNANDIPKMQHNEGGLAILGWSRGCAMALSLFASPDNIPTDTYDILRPFIKDLILYDPPSIVFGFTPAEIPADAYAPWADPLNKTPEQRAEAFKIWVSGFHASPPSGWKGKISELHPQSQRADRQTTWTDEQLARIYNPAAGAAVDVPLQLPTIQAHAKVTAENGLYDEHIARSFFPEATVTYISCRKSIWPCVWGAYEAERIYNECVMNRKNVRKMHFIAVDDANHFLHHEDPTKFLQVVKEGMRLVY